MKKNIVVVTGASSGFDALAACALTRGVTPSTLVCAKQPAAMRTRSRKWRVRDRAQRGPACDRIRAELLRQIGHGDLLAPRVNYD
jgi:hypothetical protein